MAESLRISEIMYHPADPNTEYIELTNIGTEPIDLALVTFTNGVDFTFPSVALAPGEYCLLVEDIAAFEALYGSGLPVAGRYDGKLNNAGEHLVLHDAIGEVILDFSFDDNWYNETDGWGYSLTVGDPINSDPNDWGLESTWRASQNIAGSPGSAD